MASLDAKMVEQRQLIRRVSLPAMIGFDGAARAAGIALIHGDHAIMGGKNLVQSFQARGGPPAGACHMPVCERIPPGANSSTG